MADWGTHNIPIIQGLLKEGAEVTLCDNTPSNFRLNAPGLTTEEFSPRVALLGKHIEDPAEEQFESCEFSLTNLEEWLSDKPFRFKFLDDQKRNFELRLAGRNARIQTTSYSCGH